MKWSNVEGYIISYADYGYKLLIYDLQSCSSALKFLPVLPSQPIFFLLIVLWQSKQTKDTVELPPPQPEICGMAAQEKSFKQHAVGWALGRWYWGQTLLKSGKRIEGPGQRTADRMALAGILGHDVERLSFPAEGLNTISPLLCKVLKQGKLLSDFTQ